MASLLTPRLLLMLLLTLLSGAVLPAQAVPSRGRPLIQTYDPEAYGGSDEVWQVLQGESGWIWLLTPTHLHSFDGMRWRSFAFPIENGRHLCMAPLAGGGVVLGAEGNIATCAPGPEGQLRYKSILDEEPAFQARLGRMRFLARGKHGYWFSDSQGFGSFRLDPETGLARDLRVWGPKEPGERKRPAIFFFKEIGEDVWLEFLDGGLGRLGENGPQLVPGGAHFARLPFAGLARRGKGLLVATITAGLFLFENGTATPWRTPISEVAKRGNPSGLLRLDADTYVLPTSRSGLVFFDGRGEVLRRLDTHAGLTSNSINGDPSLDREKGLWVSTGHGVARIQLDSDLVIFDDRDGIEGEIGDIEVIDGRLHVLTDQGVFRARDPGEEPGPAFEALPPTRTPAKSLSWVRGRVLVGTEMELLSFDPALERYETLVHLSSVCLETDRDKSWIFLGTRGWGLVRLQKRDQGWKVFRPEKATLETCMRVLIDEPQDAWALLDDQRGRIKIQRYSRESGYREFDEMIPPGSHEQGQEEISGFFLYEGVVHIRVGEAHYRWDEDAERFHQIEPTTIPGLAETGVTVRPIGHQGSLSWFRASGSRIFLYQQDAEGNAVVTRPLLRCQDGKWTAHYLDLDKQTLWAGGSRGHLVRCSITDPGHLPPPTQAPRFSHIAIVGNRLIHGGYGPMPIEVATSPRQFNHWRFAWALPVFEGSDRIRFRTRLAGLEEDWTSWSAQSEREFLSLPPGTYRFMVEARDARARTTPESSFDFRILPPWYQSLWVQLGAVLGLGLLVFGLVSWRNRRVRLRVHQLETVIQQREAAEHKLEESQHRYRSLVETTSDLVWEMDTDFRYRYASPRFEDQLGYDESELLSRSLFDLIAPEDQGRVKAQLTYSREAGTPFSGIQYMIVEKGGRKRRMESNGVPVFDSEGVLRGFRGIDRDVTERHAAEDERRELEDRLRQGQKLESLGRLAGGVSHDFNNILTAILGHAELVRDFCKPGTEMPPGLYSSVEEILRAGKQAADLTGRLLAFSRQQVLRPRVVDPSQVLQGLERMLHRLIREDIEIHFELAPNTRSILVDGGQLEQVIINLVVNAVDAMPDGGTLTLRTDNVTIDKTHVALHPGATEGNYVRISVTDTGHGMDLKTQSRIFEPFFTTKDLGKGTGLGLASTHGIVQQSGGHIHLVSEVDKGTTFELYFPVASRGSEDASREETMPSIEGHERILFCDDDHSVRSVAERSLAAHGYRVQTAPNAKAAMALIEEGGQEFDLLITDLIMPGQNGKELADLVRSKFPELPILFASGYSDEVILDQSELPPRTDFLPKPFTSVALLQRIRHLLDH